MPTSVETYLTSPRLDCFKREQRHGRHLFAIINMTNSFSESASHTVDLHHFTFHLPICSLGRINFMNLAEFFYIFILFFNPFCNIARAIHSKPNSIIPASSSKTFLTSGAGSPITSNRRVSISTTTTSQVQTNLPLREGGDRKKINSTTRCFLMKTQSQNKERTRDINYLQFLPL